MGRRQTGLFKRGRVFYIDKIIKGYGRLRESTGARDRREAEDYLARRLAEIGHYVSQGIQLDRTFKEAAAKYLIEMSHIRTINEAAIILDWLVAEIGEVCLVDIGPALIDQLIAKRQGMENANATVNRHMGKLRAILKKAVEWQWIVSVPKVRMLKEPKNRVRWIRQAEAEKLMAELPEHLQAMAGFTLTTGLRESNVTGLEWSQVDLERRVAWIHPDQFKTGNALGVPLNNGAMVILRGEQGRHPRWVFTYEGERVIRCNNHAWRKALLRAGIKNFRWHDLRHTWASWHVMAGTPLHVLQQLGGWKSYDMVLRYAHLSPEHLAGFADSLSGPRAVTNSPHFPPVSGKGAQHAP